MCGLEELALGVAYLHKVACRSSMIDLLAMLRFCFLEASGTLTRVIATGFFWLVTDFCQILAEEFVAVGVIFENFYFAVRDQNFLFDGDHLLFVHLLRSSLGLVDDQ